MKLLQFAVASIVDANTGYGYSRNLGNTNYGAEIHHGRNIRSRSALALLRSIGQGFADSVEQFKARLQQQRDLRQLYQLNDHLLRDIGLSTGDLHAVSEGLVSLEQLNAKRQTAQVIEVNQAVTTVAVKQNLQAANQGQFKQAKCA